MPDIGAVKIVEEGERARGWVAGVKRFSRQGDGCRGSVQKNELWWLILRHGRRHGDARWRGACRGERRPIASYQAWGYHREVGSLLL